MTGGSPAQETRRYDNAGRAEQARLARRRVIEAARTVVIERGYAATTIKSVAAAAGVSAELVYKSFGSKAALIKTVYDVTLAGDDDPADVAARPAVAAIIAAPDAETKVDRYADMAIDFTRRLGPLLAALRDCDAEFTATIDQERLIGVGRLVEHLADAGMLAVPTDRVRDAVWALLSPDLYRMLVTERGWNLDEYGEWLRAALRHELITRERRP